jgi:hypothetical protein
VSASGIDGDDSETETDTGRRPRQKAQEHQQQTRSFPQATYERQQQARKVSQDTPELSASVSNKKCVLPAGQRDASVQPKSDSITVKELIAWMTKVIPILVAAKDKNPAELLAELMGSLLSLLSRNE